MDVRTIIPVKSLAESKGRLAHLLAPEERALLTRNLLNHALAVSGATSGITQTMVVSADPQVLRIARQSGATAVVEEAPYSLNSAVAFAARLAAQAGAQAILILPADLPFLSVADLELMVAAGREEGEERPAGITRVQELEASLLPSAAPDRPLVAICPDRRGEGTNALLCRPYEEFTFHYGPYSLQRHIQEALRRDYRLSLVHAPGLQFDLDVEPDWRLLQAGDLYDIMKDLTVLPIINEPH